MQKVINLIGVLICAVNFLSCSSENKTNQTQLSGNPIFEGWYADPEAIIYGDTYWIYPTYSDKFSKQVFMDCFSSKDLINWTKHERIIDTAAVQWADSAMWAPGVIGHAKPRCAILPDRLSW